MKRRFETPLRWPAGQARTTDPKRSAFYRRVGSYRTEPWTPAQGAMAVGEELRMLGATGAEFLITTDAPVTKSGGLASNRRNPDDTGVAVWWQFGDGNDWHCLAIDRYDRIGCNLRAVAKCLESLRALERHGAPATLEQAVGGFRKALPAGDPEKVRAEALSGLRLLAQMNIDRKGLGLDADELDNQQLMRHARFGAHPDTGGGPAAWELYQLHVSALGWS